MTTTKKTKAKKLKQPEQVINKLVQEGKLAVVGKKAMADSFRLGLSVTQLIGQDIVQIFPDGSKKVLKTLDRGSSAKAL